MKQGLQAARTSAVQAACLITLGAGVLAWQPALAQKGAPAAPQSAPQAVPQTKQGTSDDAGSGGVGDPRRSRRQSVPEVDEPGVQRIGVGRATSNERSLRIIPGFSVGYTASDNIDLFPRETREPGSLLEVSPFVEVKIRRPGSTVDLNASVRGQKYWDSVFVDDRLDGDLSGTADVSISGDALRLRADGNVFRIDETGLGGTAVTGGARTQNTTIFRSFSVSPYSVGRLGLNTQYEAGYEYELIDRGTRNDSNRVFGEIQHTGFGDGRLGLLGRVDARQVEYENGFEYDNISGLLGLSWALSGRLKVGGGAYYSAIDALYDDGDNSGVGPAVYWDWRASERSAFQGQVADAYYGSNVAVRFRQLFQRWVFSANYNKGVEDGNRASTFLFRPINAFRGSTRRTSDRTLNDFNASLAERDLELGPGSQLFTAVLDSALVYDNTLSLSAAYIRPRHAGLVSLFSSDRDAATTPFGANSDRQINQWGAYGVFDYLLSSRNSVRVIGQYRRASLQDSGESSLFNGIDVSYKRTLTSRADVRFAVRYSIQDGDGGASSYKETAGTVTYTYRYK